jgi:iron complex outermembrane receptor protein
VNILSATLSHKRITHFAICSATFLSPMAWATEPPQGDGQMEEIVVTATKRSERMLDVPESISVIGSDVLERLHASGLQDLSAQEPGLVVTSGGSAGQTSITLRGLASQGAGALVATVLDDVAVGSSGAHAFQDSLQLDLFPYDIERIELLRGPQGTLYGANAMGGVLRYVTKDPNLNQTEIAVGGDGFALDDAGKPGYSVRASVGLPIIPGVLALRGSVYDQETPGYINNPQGGNTDENTLTRRGGRLVVLWEPSDVLSVKIQGIYSQIKSADNALQRATVGSGSPAEIGVFIDGLDVYNHSVPQPFENDIKYGSATINWNLGFADLTSATGVSDTHSSITADASGSLGIYIPELDPSTTSTLAGLTELVDAKRVSEELRLASKSGGRFEWLVGAYLDRERSSIYQYGVPYFENLQPITQLLPFGYADVPTRYDENAGFANVSYRLTERFDLFGGVRESRVTQSWGQSTGGILFGNSVSSSQGTSDENVFTYAAGPRFHFTPDSMVYARIATGYRAGSPQVAFANYPEIPSATKSDRTKNYELGFKTDFLKHKIAFDAAVYKIDWTRIQIPEVTPDGVVSYQVNGGTAVSKGVELSSSYQVTSGLKIGLNGAYSEAYFTSPVPLSGITDNATLPFAPKWTGAATATYVFGQVSQWTPRIDASVRRISAIFAEPSSAGAITIPGNTMADIAGAITDGRYTVSLYARNVLDARPFTSATTTYNYTTGQSLAQGILAQPRIIGLSLDARF